MKNSTSGPAVFRSRSNVSQSGGVSIAPSTSESTLLRQEVKEQEELDLARLKSVCTLDAHCIRWMNKRKAGIAEGTQNVKVFTN